MDSNHLTSWPFKCSLIMSLENNSLHSSLETGGSLVTSNGLPPVGIHVRASMLSSCTLVITERGMLYPFLSCFFSKEHCSLSSKTFIRIPNIFSISLPFCLGYLLLDPFLNFFVDHLLVATILIIPQFLPNSNKNEAGEKTYENY